MLKIKNRIGDDLNINLNINNKNTFGSKEDYINSIIEKELDKVFENNVYTDSVVYSFENPRLDYNFSFYVPLGDPKYDEYLFTYDRFSSAIFNNYARSFVYKFRTTQEIQITPSPIVGDKIFQCPEIPNQFINNSLFLFEYYDSIDVTNQKLIYSFPYYLSNLENVVDILNFTYGYAKLDTFSGVRTFSELNLNNIKNPTIKTDSINNKMGYNLVLPNFYEGNELYLKIRFFNAKNGNLISLNSSINTIVDNTNFRSQFLKIELNKNTKKYKMFSFNRFTSTYNQISNVTNLYE